MSYSGQFSVGGGPTFAFITGDGSNVTVSAYLLGQLAGAATINPNGTKSATLGGSGGPNSPQASASISTTGGASSMTVLTWSVEFFSQSGDYTVTGTLASWPTP